MKTVEWPTEETSLTQMYGWPVLPKELRQVGRGEVGLTEALQTLTHYAEEQALSAADLLERETWALTALLERSAPIWGLLADSTLRFRPDYPGQSYLEVGYFSHLAALGAPSADEQALIAATTPRWARVYVAPERQIAGYMGALAYSYVVISPAEAVVSLGFGRILTEIEAATRRAGQTMVDQMYKQQERRARLVGVEHMLLGVTPKPERSRAAQIGAKLLLDGSLALDRLLLGGAIWAMLLLLLSFLVSFNLATFLVLFGIGVAEIQLFFTVLHIMRGDRSTP